ncbi:MAG: O-antigen ligase family protein, partial [Bacteroidia bacterium]|nr:O-antigen ligase family protein [Bacteroidia bacterium]
SEDKEEWLNIVRIKLPLLFLPFAFAGPINFSKKEWEGLAYIFIALVTAGTIWSMFQYAGDIAAVHKGYLQSKTIITPLNDDHIRFSWLVCVSLLLTGWLLISNRKQNKFIAGLLAATSIWFILFLHILAARTGLISFYLVILIIIFRLIYKKTNPIYTIPLLAIIILLPVIAYFVLPTFQNRVKYFLYNLTYFKDAHYLQGSNDAVRVISLRAGWNVMNEKPAYGVGFGNVLKETKKWYRENYPQMIEADKIYPSSEWLMYGAACGWPGVLLFSLVMLISFFIKTENKLLWWLLNATAAFSFLFDIGLEVQFGVFSYAFVILWWWKYFNTLKNPKEVTFNVSGKKI